MENDKMTTFKQTDIYSSDEFDVIPEYVELTVTDTTIGLIESAIKCLKDNPSFGAIEIKDNIQADVSEDFDGKARYFKLNISVYGGIPNIWLFFYNDYTSTRYEVDYSDDLNKLMGVL